MFKVFVMLLALVSTPALSEARVSTSFGVEMKTSFGRMGKFFGQFRPVLGMPLIQSFSGGDMQPAGALGVGLRMWKMGFIYSSAGSLFFSDGTNIAFDERYWVTWAIEDTLSIGFSHGVGNNGDGRSGSVGLWWDMTTGRSYNEMLSD